MSKNRTLCYGIFAVVVLALAVAGWFIVQGFRNSGTREQPQLESSREQEFSPPQRFSVFDRRLLFSGGYADPSVIQMSDGTYLMYLAGHPKNGGSRGVFILRSSDGISWQEETGTIFPGVAVARALRFHDGVRYYYHQPPREKKDRGTIVSSFSKDGITGWRYEGVRIRPREGYAVAGPAIVRLKNGSYRMFFFEGRSREQRRRQVTDSEIYGASSVDGLDWVRDEEPTIVYENTVEGADLRHQQSRQVLHPFVMQWPEKDGYLMLYNSHSRIFAGFSRDGFRWEKLGYIGVVGADADAVRLPDGTFRIYFGGGCTDVSRAFVYADEVKDRPGCVDPGTGEAITLPSTIHTAILRIAEV